MRTRRAFWVVGAVIALMVGLTACGEPSANALEEGDCIDAEIGGDVGEDDKVDCEESHSAEVYSTFDLEGDDFPGVEEVQAQADERCLEDFEGYVGLPYEDSTIDFTTLNPSEDSWNDNDDRTVLCLAVSLDGSDTEGSVEGAEV